MNPTTPAIATQAAVRRLPRAALWLLCLAYLLPGALGRDPWRTADITAFGFMSELADGRAPWLAPTLLGRAPEVDGLLPYWMGAWAIQAGTPWLPPDLAVRFPFLLMLLVAFAATWYASYYLARDDRAQPVAFAFGGEASRTDYARALADGALLALLANLGLAQLSHETTPAVVQLACTALCFAGFAVLPTLQWQGITGVALGLAGLTLSGAPTLALLLGGGGTLAMVATPREADEATDNRVRPWLGPLLVTAFVAAWASGLALWRWRIDLPHLDAARWSGLIRMLAWFTWPCWPLVLWTLWRWRQQWLRLRSPSRHLILPLWFSASAIGTSIATGSDDRALLLALPALATLAAQALPTLRRSVSALIDWFTLLFFSGCALVIWVVWIAMQSGVPPQPAANVERLAPGFIHSFAWLPFLFALIATGAWGWLVRWRAGRHRAALWKSLVLPASGATLCWLLLMTLWLPLLDYARSYRPLTQQLAQALSFDGCVESRNLSDGEVSALRLYLGMDLRPTHPSVGCNWLIARPGPDPSSVPAREIWHEQVRVHHPVDRHEEWVVYHRLR
ncbi:MAG: hypothetical protein FGM55_10385 [Rhodoferax sp.]|nr:hypothetical protein [Rhodoferax sp.]